MFENDTAAWMYALLTAGFGLLAGGLTLAALRNHFKTKKMRPAVIAEAALFAALSAFFALRVLANLLLAAYPASTTGTTLLTGSIADAVLLALLTTTAWTFVTLVFAYPDSHHGENVDVGARIKHYTD